MRERGKLPYLATCLLAQACQHLWLASSHDVYRRFTWIDRAIPPWLPTALMLAVIISPHGSMTIQLDEATLSQELRTARLLWPHVLVGYRWQHTGLHPEPFRPVITDTCVTSCRSPHRTGREPYQFIRLSSDPWPCSGCIPPSPACHEWHGDGSASTPPGSSVGARPSGGPRLVARLSPVGVDPATS